MQRDPSPSLLPAPPLDEADVAAVLALVRRARAAAEWQAADQEADPSPRRQGTDSQEGRDG